MKRDDLIRELRRHARRHDPAFDLDKGGGKGSHDRVRPGARVSTVQSGALTPFHVRRIRLQLGIETDRATVPRPSDRE